MTQYSQEQIMLSLALLSYRGFWAPSPSDQETLSANIANGLDELAPLNGEWQLIWGPGTYRFLGSTFDDAMMYVAQHRQHRERCTIVVRGTNPIALFDWLFGDFLAYRQLPWRPGGNAVAAGAKLSVSTALGLKTLLNMRAEPAAQLASGEPGRLDFLHDLGVGVTDRLQGFKSSAAKRVRYQQARGLVEQLRWYQNLWGFTHQMAEGVTPQFGGTLSASHARRLLGIRRRLLKLFDALIGTAGDTALDVLVPILEEQVTRPERERRGIGLLDVLRQLAEQHGDKLELFVTGHSKGGALAPALALSLADTQGRDDIPVASRWNPSGAATIHCHAFAGPTPGNSAFAEHFNQQLGAHSYRYANKLDIVTHAWTPQGLRSAPNVYGAAVPRIPGLELLAQVVAEDVADLDYCHVDRADRGGRQADDKHVIEFSGPLCESAITFFTQEIHQHVQAYINAAGLQDVIDLSDLIGDADVSLTQLLAS